LIPIFSDTRRKVSQLALASAISKAVELGAHVINVSCGQLTYSGESDDLLARAIEAAHKKNILVVAAAGNDRDAAKNRDECLHVPAALPMVLTVGAMDENGHPLDSSCWSKSLRAQGVLALGRDVLGAVPGGNQVHRLNGTSFATPIVSGVAGLLLSWQLKHGHKPAPYQIRAAILSGAKPCDPMEIDDCSPYMAGELDAVGALKSLSREFAMSEQVEPHVQAQSETVATSAPVISPQTSQLPMQAAWHVPPAATFAGVSPSADVSPSGDCGCGGDGKGLVFFIGLVGYDFGSEARRDTFKQQMPPAWYRQIDGREEFHYAEDLSQADVEKLLGDGFRQVPPNPFDARQMVAYLKFRPDEATQLIWTLNLELTPVYSVTPVGPYANRVYDTLINMLDGQSRAEESPGYVERVSVPAVLAGHSVRLFSG
jgi:hypothetical protein